MSPGISYKATENTKPLTEYGFQNPTKRKVIIPFRDWSKKKLKLGHKTATSRSKKYGEVGDCFYEVGKKFKIKMICKFPLWFIRDFLWFVEGADNKKEFETVWRNIHPISKFDFPDEQFHVHFFEEISE